MGAPGSGEWQAGDKGSIDVRWPSSDFSLLLDTFPCCAPLAFGQHQIQIIS